VLSYIACRVAYESNVCCIQSFDMQHILLALIAANSKPRRLSTTARARTGETWRLVSDQLASRIKGEARERARRTTTETDNRCGVQ
jgi:hypothetical protein